MIKLKDIIKGKVYTDKDLNPFKLQEKDINPAWHQDAMSRGIPEDSIASWSDDKKTLRWKVYIAGEKEPLILTGRSASEVKKFAHQMIQNNKVKIQKVVKEGLDEAKKIKVPQPSDFGGDFEKYLDALNKHMKDIEKLAKKQKKVKKEGKLNEFGVTAPSVHDTFIAPKRDVSKGPSNFLEKYSSTEAKDIIDGAIKNWVDSLRKSQYNIIKDWMTAAKSGKIDFFDLIRGLKTGDARRAHPYETEFMVKVLTKDKVIDRFRKYFDGKKGKPRK